MPGRQSRSGLCLDRGWKTSEGGRVRGNLALIQLTSDKFVKRTLKLCKESMQDYDLRAFGKAIIILALPAAVLAVTYLLLDQATTLPRSVRALVAYLPYVLFASGMALAWRFNRSRSFFVLGVLLLAYWTLSSYLGQISPRGATWRAFYGGICFLVPFNFAVFALLKERGIFTRHGSLRFGFIFLQAGLLAWFAHAQAPGILHYTTLKLDSAGILGYAKLPQPAQLMFMVTAVFLAIRFFFRRSTLESAFLGALVGVALAFDAARPGLATAGYFAAAGLILTIALVQDSYSMAFHDELTGLSARRALNEQLLKLGSRYVIAMADVDHFKKFNDTYGHDVGDQVLRFVASRLRRVGAGGKAYRYGGEEFTVLFPGKSIEDVYDALEAVRESVGRSEFTLRAKRRPRVKPEYQPERKKPSKHTSVTISIGVAQPDDEAWSPQEVLKAADKALYRAKEKGRDQVSD